jgi:hypothetical protein
MWMLGLIACLHGVPPEDWPDRDRDGIEDRLDACPFTPEDHDRGNDQDGCPDGGARNPRLQR